MQVRELPPTAHHARRYHEPPAHTKARVCSAAQATNSNTSPLHELSRYDVETRPACDHRKGYAAAWSTRFYEGSASIPRSVVMLRVDSVLCDPYDESFSVLQCSQVGSRSIERESHVPAHVTGWTRGGQ